MKKEILFVLGLLFFIPCYGQLSVDILVVSGGGSGGSQFGGGGGGGAVRYWASQSLNAGSVSVVVGAGGAAVNAAAGPGNPGQSSSFGSSYVATSGSASNGNGRSGGTCGSCGLGGGGGSGGGGSGGFHNDQGNGGTAITGMGGNSGGRGSSYNQFYYGAAGGGGGGAGGAGANASLIGNNGKGGNGGVGVSNNITGTSVFYGGGGGGGQSSNSNQASGSGGNGGGGAGCKGSCSATNGTPNTGGGGGGGGGGAVSPKATSGSGGSGVVIIRYAANAALATGGTITSYTGNGTNGTNGLVYQVHRFTSNGTFVYTSIITTQPSTSTQNICINGSPAALTVAATGTTKTYQWFSNTTASNTGGTSITGATATSFTPPTNVVGTRYYYCVVNSTTSSVTTTQSSNVSGAVIVSNPSVAGTITGANSVTSGTNSTVLTLSGHTGSIQWQISTDGTSFNPISGAVNASYTATNLSATSHYRALVTSGGCSSVTSASATVLVLPSTTPVSTSLNVSGTSSTISINNNTATVVDGSLAVTGSGNISGFAVSISENYSNGDVLGYTGSLPSGVTTTGFRTQSRSIVFNGSASAAAWQALLRTVTLTSTAVTCSPEKRTVTFSVSTMFYNYFNGHFYEYVPSGKVWTDAKSHAESKSFFGMQGYLAVISSAAENAYISTLIGQNSWLGATDNFVEINKALGYQKFANQSQAEGKYYWVTGPEKGTPFTQSGVYRRWQSGEPNNFNTGFYDRITRSFGEHYLHIYANRNTWNDFPNDRRLGSIIEYGGMPGDNPVGSVSFSRDITVQGLTGGGITGGGVTVCAGTNSSVLTLTGNTGTVSKWQYSNDNFLTDIHDISNTSTSYTVTNIDTTRFFRAIMVNGSCVLATPSTIVTVNPSNPGSVTAVTNEVCPNGTANLQVSGYFGTVSKWQITSDPITNVTSTTDINVTSDALSHTLTTTGDYLFRAIISNSACSQTFETDWYPIVVASSTTPKGGEVTSAAHCGSANSGVLTLNGASGSSYQWEKSTNGGANWSNESSTSTSLAYYNIGQNTLFRVLVSSGSCGSAYSSIGEVQIYGTNICEWTGAQNTVWSNAGNWCGGVVGSNGRRVAISMDAKNDAVLDANLYLSSLDFNASGRKVILGTHNLKVDDLIGIDSVNYVQTYSTGYLYQTINHLDSFTFGVGNASYNPVKITNKTGSADEFTVYVFDEVYERGTKGNGNAMGNAKRIQRTWEIGKANANGGAGVDFVFEWEVKHKKNLDVTRTKLNHYNSTQNKWEFASHSSIERGVSFLQVNGYSGGFSPFSIGEEGLEPLPVTLSKFTATYRNPIVSLEWETTQEEQSSHFEVQRSADASDWNELGSVAAQGQSFVKVNYEFTDLFPQPEVNYYRLKQVDLDGQFAYSNIRIVWQTGQNDILTHLWPNPNNGSFKVQVPGFAHYVLTSVSGKQLDKGRFTEEKVFEGLSAGVYFLTLDYAGKTAQFKVLVID